MGTPPGGCAAAPPCPSWAPSCKMLSPVQQVPRPSDGSTGGIASKGFQPDRTLDSDQADSWLIVGKSITLPVPQFLLL